MMKNKISSKHLLFCGIFLFLMFLSVPLFGLSQEVNLSNELILNQIQEKINQLAAQIEKVRELLSSLLAYSNYYKLRYSVSPSGSGTLDINPRGSYCGSGCYYYWRGTVVDLTANPNSGYFFSRWGYDCSGYTDNYCTLVMDTNRYARAIFEKGKTLTISTPSGGRVEGPGISCPGDCTETYRSGEVVTLTANPDYGYLFKNWSSNCTPSNQPTCSVTMNQNQTVRVTFERGYTLSVSYAGGLGTITSEDGGIYCGPGYTDCNETYTPYTRVDLMATPEYGYKFDSWSGDCTPNSTYPYICTTVMNGHKQITAYFKEAYRLTVIKYGNGTVVSENYPGIDCGYDCEEDYSPNITVRLRATRGSGSSRIQWSGCDRTVPVDPTTSYCYVTMNNHRTVSVNFY
jgi:hypothetical protein